MEQSLLGFDGGGAAAAGSVRSQHAGFPISISDVLDFWLSWVKGQGSFLWYWVGPRQCRMSGWREGRRSQPWDP